MRRVSGCVRHVKLAARRSEALVACKHGDRLARHGSHLAPQPIHRVAVQPCGARQQLRRIDQVRRARFVDEHAQPRIVAHERARGARMIEMDVRQQQRRHVGHRDAGAFELASKHGKGARWSGIDQRHAAFAVQHAGGDDARHALKQQIDVRKS